MIIVVDEPTTAHYGATVAAPYISRMMSKVLPYLGYEPQYTEKEAELLPVTIGNYVGMTVAEASEALKKIGLTADFGDANRTDTVTAQMPTAGNELNSSLGRVILYTDCRPREDAVVPNLLGLPMTEAVEKLLDCGLNIRLAGTLNEVTDEKAYPKAARQSIVPGTQVVRGTTVTVEFLYDDTE